MNRISILFLGCLVIAGCGGDKGSQNTPLTADQKTQFGGTLESVGRVQKAGTEAQKATHRDAAPVSQDEKMKKMAERMADAKCDFVLPKVSTEPNQDPFNQTIEQGMKVSGATCPITMDFSLKMKSQMTQTSFSNTIDFLMKYDVKDAEFNALNDINGIDMKGSGSINAGQTSIDGSLDIDGVLKSQANGDLKMYVVGKVKGSGDQTNQNLTSELVWGVKYPTYTAELKMTETQANKNVTKEYFLNGQKLTEQEFRDLLQKAGTLGEIKISTQR